MQIWYLITTFLPLLISLIQGLDRLFPAAKIGPFKLAVAAHVLVALKPYFTGGAVPIEELIAVIAPKLITDIVASMNEHPETWGMTPTPVVGLVVVGG